ncbi:biopolymer transporter ExbD [Emticicia sp. BO119]|uniref:ExbD/TolR family protein n=1 Tax=Emticicia sp. BO119 TaxID=2757768 RepID=UPI0015EFFB98|nr:biopolymer transporter ExbD [Emticicia sp. BO119]MBA4849685.1 biopolymer transporter ExbD [Emticicia sp. BO119]
MAAPKPARKSPSMDMTAMCDVAFLLLTFFIMTTQFKSQESVTVDTPSSVSEIKVEDKDMATITIDKDGKYYFGVTNPLDRYSLIQKMNDKYGAGLSDAEQKNFTKLAETGVSITSLKQYLALPEAQRGQVRIQGIPNDSTKSELVDWVKTYLTDINKKAKLAVRGDVQTQYPAIKKLFAELGKNDINKFQLITDSENKEDK